MSVTFDSSTGICSIGGEGSGLRRGLVGNRKGVGTCSESSSSSSIGKNSDLTGGEDSGESTTTEVESPYKGGGGGGGPLEGMEALEEVLPVRRGISRFYNGKSKSFASLAHASSIHDLAKAENAYTRKRRNLLASSLIWEKSRSGSSSPLSCNAGGISKRTLTNLSRTNLAFAVAMAAGAADNNGNSSQDTGSNKILVSPATSPLRHDHKPLMSSSPQIHRDLSAWRSLSLADLQCATASDAAIATVPTTSDETPKPPY